MYLSNPERNICSTISEEELIVIDIHFNQFRKFSIFAIINLEQVFALQQIYPLCDKP